MTQTARAEPFTVQNVKSQENLGNYRLNNEDRVYIVMVILEYKYATYTLSVFHPSTHSQSFKVLGCCVKACISRS